MAPYEGAGEGGVSQVVSDINICCCCVLYGANEGFDCCCWNIIHLWTVMDCDGCHGLLLEMRFEIVTNSFIAAVVVVVAR